MYVPSFRFTPCSMEWRFGNKTYVHQCEKKLDPPMHPTCQEFHSTVRSSQIQPMGPVVLETKMGVVDCPPRQGKNYRE